jgi:nitrate/nitrite-specific signal transduction histidine kinase
MRIEDATRPQLLHVVRTLLQERDELQGKLDALDDAHRRLCEDNAALEREHAIVSQLHVASRLLHRSLDRAQVVAAVVEICINLVGSEQLALFAHDRAAKRLHLVASFGVDKAAFASVPLADDTIGAAARSGAMQLALGAETAETRPAVCVPLRVESEVVGVLVLFRLLPHKSGLEPVDHALLDLLSIEGGVALAATAEER